MSNIIDKIQVSGVTYTIQGSGGGKAIEAGRGIAITTGETVDTVSFDLPISAGTGTNSIVEGLNTTASGNSSHAEGEYTNASGYASHAEGYGTIANGNSSHAEGDTTTANGRNSHAEGYGTEASGDSSHAEGNITTARGNYSHAEGNRTTANGNNSHAEGSSTKTTNQSEHASGQFNSSYSASTTFGDSGNTLFSVGNGTGANARHNAFEIRQNGDIYLSSGGTDIKLQDHLGGGSVTVDTALDSGSTNPVQNKVIYNKIDEVEEVTAAGLNALNDKITPTVELTQAQYDALVSAGTVSADTYYIITDAEAGDLTNYYTKSETNTLLGGKADTATTYTKTEVDTALSNKQTTLTAGTGIDITDNVISATGGGGGGKAVSGGTNISITTGETADTINCTLPFSYEGDNLKTTVSGNSFVNYFHYGQIFGVNNTLQGRNSDISNAESGSTIIGNGNQILRNKNSIVIGSSNSLGNIFGINNQNYVFGYSNTLNPAGTNDNIINNNFVIGNNNVINKKSNNFIFGYGIKPSNDDEFSLGKYNNSVSGSTTFGDSGNTLFSVGNGTADNARHNAFEIRQNGDIYLTLDGQDVKLQDQLGGSSITVDTALDSGSTNPVENRVIYNKIDEVEQVTAAALNNINDRLSEDEEVTAAGLNALNDNFGGLKLVKLTQAEYNALATKDSSTLYIIVN